MTKLKIAVLVGSLSRDSINKKLSQALQRAGRDKFDYVEVEFDDLPIYNRDLDGALPQSVARMKAQIEGTDGILIVSPEYNRSIPSALKNVLDWASRPYGASSWRGKVAAIAGASSGAIGTAVGQTHLRTVLTHLDVLTLPQPELYIKWDDSLVSADGEAVSVQFRELLERFMVRFAALVKAKP